MVLVKSCLLKAYPVGPIGPEHFEYPPAVDVNTLEVADGQLWIELQHISVDPYMRSRFTAHLHYFFPPFQPGKPIESACIAVVKQSQAKGFAEGDVVTGMMPWITQQVIAAEGLQKLDTSGSTTPITYFLGILGPTGMTAYPSFKELALPKLTKDSVVVVSGAAGAVGAVFGQLCKNVVGCTVYGSAGTEEKLEYCKSIGYDKVFNYKNGIAAGLEQVLGDAKIDLYFDNVAGEFLDECLPRMAKYGTILACGGMSKYNDEAEPAQELKNYMKIVYSSLTVRGFIMPDYLDNLPALVGELAALIAQGKVVPRETVLHGFENAANAFLGLFKGENIGKMVCSL